MLQLLKMNEQRKLAFASGGQLLCLSYRWLSACCSVRTMKATKASITKGYSETKRAMAPVTNMPYQPVVHATKSREAIVIVRHIFSSPLCIKLYFSTTSH